MEYKGFKVDDNKIDEYVEKLDLSISEACNLILEEEGKIKESEETTKAIESIKAERRYEKSDKARKPVKRERKVDKEKLKYITLLAETLENAGLQVTAIKTETEINFTDNGIDYTVKLTKHRPPKK